MTLGWMDTSQQSFNTLLLLEKIQLSWLPGVPEKEMALALRANPVVAWYLRHKCPGLTEWLDHLETIHFDSVTSEQIFKAEQTIMQRINDWLVYVVDPKIYDQQPFLGWADSELFELADFKNMVVADVGAGTGRLAMLAAPLARSVFAIEPVGNLRTYLKEKACRLRFNNVFVVDGLVAEIPFPDHFFDITMGGHVFGDTPQDEIRELERVTQPGGKVILCPGNPDVNNTAHQVLLDHQYQFSRFEEPQSGWVRKYWKVIGALVPHSQA